MILRDSFPFYDVFLSQMESIFIFLSDDLPLRYFPHPGPNRRSIRYLQPREAAKPVPNLSLPGAVGGRA